MIIILDYLSELNPEILILNGMNEAIVGYVERCGTDPLVCYDVEKCIQILIDRDDMTDEEAMEFFSYNILGAYMGEHTPMFLTRVDSELI